MDSRSVCYFDDYNICNNTADGSNLPDNVGELCYGVVLLIRTNGANQLSLFIAH